MRVVAAEPRDFAWLAERTSAAMTDHATAIKAVDASGRIRGMVVYDYWTPNSCQAHMAVDAPIVWRSLLRPAFEYPFEELGRSIILGIVAGDNPRSLAMVKALGFREVHRVHDGWAPGVPLIVHEMRRGECRWLQGWHRGSRHGCPCHSPLEVTRAPGIQLSAQIERLPMLSAARTPAARIQEGA